MSSLTSALHSFARSDADMDDERLRDEAGRCGASKVADCRNRALHSFRGVLASVTLPPGSTDPHFAADLYDGSGHLTLIWMGRRDIPGIRPGTRMHVTGRVMIRDGQPVMFNPTYDVLTSEPLPGAVLNRP